MVANFDREKFLAGFNTKAHIFKSLTICAVLMTGSIYLARQAHPLDWLFVIVFWMIANFVEWNFHKYLVGKDGKVVRAFEAGVEPTDADLIAAIDAALK